MTREEKIELLEKEKAYMIGHGGDRQAKALDSAIKALKQEIELFKSGLLKDCESCKAKQESPLDKIIAEIEALPKTYPYVNHFDMYVKVSDVTKIIDKYKVGEE